MTTKEQEPTRSRSRSPSKEKEPDRCRSRSIMEQESDCHKRRSRDTSKEPASSRLVRYTTLSLLYFVQVRPKLILPQ